MESLYAFTGAALCAYMIYANAFGYMPLGTGSSSPKTRSQVLFINHK
ncbi:MAG: hypothetical protein ACAI35_13605 [Candidatus Methylacidiphilales bacterium]|nr:hypothetical protein [Candidatus Methylacidiphilales bacterium]